MNSKNLLPLYFALVLILGLLLGINVNKRDVKPVNGKTFDNIDNVLSLIKNDYVDSVKMDELQVKAIKEMLSEMDPHSEYIEPEILDDVNDQLLSSFEGIGVSFRIEKDTVTILEVIKGGPSEKVGIKAGDRIVYVNDSLIAGVGIQNTGAMRLLKGPKNTKVDVKIHRYDVPELLDFTITRDVIPNNSIISSFMIDENIGFIKLTRFASSTYKEFVDAIKELKKEGMTQLVLDLRGNTGGYLGTAVDMIDEMLPKGSLIVYTEGEHRPRNYLYARRHGILENDDIAVLIDEGSASASEIVAGALQDNDKGIIIGRRSFGKGLVQEQFDLPNGAALRLTVARYYTPTGRCIQKPFSGNKEEYMFEAWDRYESGEMFSADSIHFADSLKYVTPGGKTVYGGGGIMPDIYVPLKNDSSEYFFNKIVNSSILFQNAFEYTDKNRKNIAAYKTVENFDKNFKMPEKEFDKMLKDAEKLDILGDEEDIKTARRLAEPLFKAYIARDIFGDDGFYQIYAPSDDILQKALSELRKIEKNQD